MRALLTASFLLATLLLGTPVATAAPPTPADPPVILTPTEPPPPKPCEARPMPCDLTLPTDEPTGASEPTEPTEDPTTTTQNTGTRTDDPDNTETGNASGQVRSTPVRPTGTDGTEWWLIAVPVLALLALAAAGAVLVVQRSERR
ncbi:hypothetical protein [Actinophytocola oryzae]|uniref:LPXTG-motif cell wall-anchored protein n=1 Tax=Actinophytocola oryzae TaxID=502181 RepID=A0A4R7VZM1_9PSEU|nr:hypothetical protein [Actinophytocola oryzae]TDV55118.1 hypothetical protein CLV71_103359 [Actinophytocola oryzae]